MSTVKRYDLWEDYNTASEMFEDAEGMYVEYSDYEKLESENIKLQSKLDKAIDTLKRQIIPQREAFLSLAMITEIKETIKELEGEK